MACFALKSSFLCEQNKGSLVPRMWTLPYYLVPLPYHSLVKCYTAAVIEQSYRSSTVALLTSRVSVLCTVKYKLWEQSKHFAYFRREGRKFLLQERIRQDVILRRHPL